MPGTAEAVEEVEEFPIVVADIEPTGEENRPGTCTVSAALTINLGNYESIKVNVGFSEPYSGVGDDTRENKYNELTSLVNDKLQDSVIGYTKTAKGLSIEIHKYLKKNNE